MSEAIQERNIDTLREWDDNPRHIPEAELARVAAQVARFGLYKPLIITDDGTVLGGNARLKACRKLGMAKVWVSVVNAPDDDSKLAYALSDNDVVGVYDQAQVKAFMGLYPGLKDTFRVSTGLAKTADAFMIDREKKNDVAFADGPEEHGPDGDERAAGDKEQTDGYIHKIVLAFPGAIFGTVLERLMKYAEAKGLRNNTEAVAHLTERWSAAHKA